MSRHRNVRTMNFEDGMWSTLYNCYMYDTIPLTGYVTATVCRAVKCYFKTTQIFMKYDFVINGYTTTCPLVHMYPTDRLAVSCLNVDLPKR